MQTVAQSFALDSQWHRYTNIDTFPWIQTPFSSKLLFFLFFSFHVKSIFHLRLFIINFPFYIHLKRNVFLPTFGPNKAKYISWYQKENEVKKQNSFLPHTQHVVSVWSCVTDDCWLAVQGFTEILSDREELSIDEEWAITFLCCINVSDSQPQHVEISAAISPSDSKS